LQDNVAAAQAGSLEQAAAAAAGEALADPVVASPAAEATVSAAAADAGAGAPREEAGEWEQQQPAGPTWGVDDYEEEFRQLSHQLQVGCKGGRRQQLQVLQQLSSPEYMWTLHMFIGLLTSRLPLAVTCATCSHFNCMHALRRTQLAI
jgi:hypothetical protein